MSKTTDYRQTFADNLHTSSIRRANFARPLCQPGGLLSLMLFVVLTVGCAQEKGEEQVAQGDQGSAPPVEVVEQTPPQVAPPQVAPNPSPAPTEFRPTFVNPEEVPPPQMQQPVPEQQFGFSDQSTARMPAQAQQLPQYAPRSMAPQAAESSPSLQRSVAPRMSQYSQPQSVPQNTQPQGMQPQAMQPQAMQSQAMPAQPMQTEAMQPRMMQAPPQVAPQTSPPMQSMANDPPSWNMEAEAQSNAPNNDPFDVVEVFYGTDRAPMLWPGGVLPHKFHALLPAALCVLLGLVVGLVLTRFKQYIIAGLTVVVALTGSVVVGQEGWVQYHKYDRFLSNDSVVYGKEQGELQLGTCKVSIPKSHQAGKLESPSVISWEFEEKPEDHVMLMEVKSKEEQAFFDMLKTRVAMSPNQDLLIFVHGYNVTFEDAARRTAQIAHDLDFKGAPVFFSWPSQGELLGYVVDRGNSFWTASHLKEFLLKVHQHSGAQSVHLIAHSMGNRAFGAAVESLAQDLGQNQKMFNEVILAAPDVDAKIFQEEIAPRLTGLANHVTLYASQNDLALKASRAVNGYPRAGDVGANILILNGIDTIDVTQIDTSLMGHAYYGDNTTVISDIYALLKNAHRPTQREWLRDISSPGGMYWYFDPQYNNSVTRAPSTPPLR